MPTLMEILAAKKAAEQQPIPVGEPAAPIQSSVIAIEPLTYEQKEANLVEEPILVEATDTHTANLTTANNVLTNEEVADIVLTPENVLDIKMDETILAEAAITVDDIIPRIRALNSLSDMQVEREMPLLKAALLANPAAVSLMLPTDVGLLVASRRRITQEAIIATAAKKEKKPKTAKLSDMSPEAVAAIDDF
jgi:hypothetical protein